MISLLFAVLVAQDFPRAQAPVGPLAHWKGDDGAIDSSGNGFAGTLSPGATTSKDVAPLKVPNAGSFGLDGTAGVVSIPDAPVLRMPRDFTISFWKRKTANVADWVRIVGKGNGGQRNFGLWEYPGDGGQLKFQIYNQNGGSVLEVDSQAMPSINTWHHIVCWVSVNAAGLCVDGKPAAFGTRTGDPGIAPDPITFGHAGYHGFFPGQIDDIRLYDRALSMSEIAYLAEGKGAPEPPTALKIDNGTLSWTATSTVPPAGTATYYAVKRSNKLAACLLTSTSWIDPKPEAGATYVVTAINTGGESAPSNETKSP
jgi:large repetitive protein